MIQHFLNIFDFEVVHFMFVVVYRLSVALDLAEGRISIRLVNFPVDIGWIIEFLSLLLLIYVVYIGFRLKNVLVICLSVFQLILMVLFKVFYPVTEPVEVFVIDTLSLAMVFLVSIIGPAILIFATRYMKKHQHHMQIKRSGQPRFLMILFILISAMNALVITNNIMWVYFFWQVITVCSFLLISHDEARESKKTALKPLCINMLGGVAYIAAAIIIYKARGTISIGCIFTAKIVSGFLLLYTLAVALVAFWAKRK